LSLVFSDFDAIANDIKIFQNPFNADIETLAPELQMEMVDLQRAANRGKNMGILTSSKDVDDYEYLEFSDSRILLEQTREKRLNIS
jgi:hypothetical protein